MHQQQQQQQQQHQHQQSQNLNGQQHQNDAYGYDRQAGDETEDEDGAQQPTNGSGAAKKKNKKKKKKNNSTAATAGGNGTMPSADAVQAAVAADVAARAAAENAAASAKMRTTATVTVPPPRQHQQTTAAGKQPQHSQAMTQQQQHQAYLASAPSIAPKAGPSSERERIRDFWLGLKESERRALVKVEKEAVLKKMKEQQRSGCSCAVCGRKRCVVHSIYGHLGCRLTFLAVIDLPSRRSSRSCMTLTTTSWSLTRCTRYGTRTLHLALSPRLQALDLSQVQSTPRRRLLRMLLLQRRSTQGS
jgi:hypothetical protein